MLTFSIKPFKNKFFETNKIQTKCINLYFVISFKEWCYGFGKSHLLNLKRYLENQITLCIFNSTKQKEKKYAIIAIQEDFTFHKLLCHGWNRRDLLVRVTTFLQNMNSHALLIHLVVDKPYTTIIIQTLYTTWGDSWGTLIKHY